MAGWYRLHGETSIVKTIKVFSLKTPMRSAEPSASAKIEAYESVDQHMGRVGDVLTEDHLERSFADLNMEFSATLDQDNPLSSRY